MQKFIIQGRQTLKGEIRVAGDKNTALKLIPACVLIPGVTQLDNVPRIQDVKVIIELLKRIGAKIEESNDGHTLRIDTKKITTTKLPTDLVTKARASSMLVGPLLARFGSVELHHPGGDIIGERPLDLLLDGLKRLGASISQKDRVYQIKTKQLKGGRIVFRRVSVTGTENLLLAAVLAQGTTEIINAALEPSVTALAEFLKKRGARIEGIGSPVLKIIGVESLKIIEEPVTIIPDRIEAGTFACLAAANNAEITITACEPNHLEVFLKTLMDIGVKYQRTQNSLKILKRSGPLRATNIITHEYPGLATDHQAPLTVLLTQASGVSLVHETIYEARLFYTDKLKQMGAKVIMADPHRVIIEGPAALTGRKIISPDIRAGIALLIAGLIAEGTTTIGNVYQIDRGYEEIDKRLANLGAAIKRVETDYF